jgi:hypothetical protein
MVDESQAVRYYSSAQEKQTEAGKTPIRNFFIQEAIIDGASVAQIPFSRAEGYEYPPDLSKYQEYQDLYDYVPSCAQATDIKRSYAWQQGYTLESTNPPAKGEDPRVKAANEWLKSMEAETALREGTLIALIYGNAYWYWDGNKLIPLDPKKAGLKKNDKKEIIKYHIDEKDYMPSQILHFALNKLPWEDFGTSSIRRVYHTEIAILYMKEKVPEIARRRSDPFLDVMIDDPNPAEWKKKAEQIKNREPGKDIFHGPGVTINEVYKSGGIAPRQTIEGILDIYKQDEIAGLGVPEVGLGLGSTTLKGTAEYQSKSFESSERDLQRQLKRFMENIVLPLGDFNDIRVNFRSITPEDMKSTSEKLNNEIEHGVISPKEARAKLGYPEEVAGDLMIKAELLPMISGALPPPTPTPEQPPKPKEAKTRGRPKKWQITQLS